MRFIPQISLLVLLATSLMVGCKEKTKPPAPPEAEQAKEPEGNGVELGDNVWVIETPSATISGNKGTTEGPGSGLSLSLENEAGQGLLISGFMMTEKTGRFFDPQMVSVTLEKGANDCLAGSSLTAIADIAGRSRGPSLDGEITENDDTHVAGYFEGRLWCNPDMRDPQPIEIKGVFDVPRAAPEEGADEPADAGSAASQQGDAAVDAKK